MNDKTIRKYFKETMATAKCHLDQEMKNLQSTQQKELDEDSFPLPESPNIKCYNTLSIIEKATSYRNLTGRFPHQSTEGNNYILITYDCDGNCISIQAIPNHEAKTIATAWETNHKNYEKWRWYQSIIF